MTDHLARILDRKSRENARRRAHERLFVPARAARSTPRGAERAPDPVLDALRRKGPSPRVIAELKLRSPSEGELRARRAGELVAIARAYEDAGAAAISVLCDRAGFGGSVLDLRRVARAVRLPVLFKEFVLEESQLDLARAAGASLALLLVRALDRARLAALVDACLARGLVPLVEAADARELDVALETAAPVVGVNARDLRSFAVDAERARALVEKVPRSRIAVYMSGVASAHELERVGQGRADAVLIGSALMRAPSPAGLLREWLAERR